MCSCGESGVHAVMRRRTADDVALVLWSNGPVTGSLGIGLPGLPFARPKSEQTLRHALTAGRLLLESACLYDLAELGPVYAACRRTAEIDGLPGTVRRIMRERAARGALVLSWTVMAADRDGTPTERIARLPRLRWPGLVVVDFCGGPGSARGRYQIWREVDGTLYRTGFEFRTQAELTRHLKGVE